MSKTRKRRSKRKDHVHCKAIHISYKHRYNSPAIKQPTTNLKITETNQYIETIKEMKEENLNQTVTIKSLQKSIQTPQDLKKS
jgi:hypothetical protein